MPRIARLDRPGLLQHVMARGVDRREIFSDHLDRGAFVRWLGEACTAARAQCFAWALMPNHVHLLLMRSDVSLGVLMQRLLGRYARYFNRRHGRRGHLFEDRFKSIACQADRYFLELVRYIHLNPLHGRVVRSPTELDRHPWTGHAALLGSRALPWFSTDRVLRAFHRRPATARRAYRKFVFERWRDPRDRTLSEGVAVRTHGASIAPQPMARDGSDPLRDARVLGDDQFVRSLCTEVADRPGRPSRKSGRWTPQAVVARAARQFDLEPEALVGPCKERRRSRARALACHWLLDELGARVTDIARLLQIRPSAIRAAAERAHNPQSPPRLPARP